MKTWKIATIIGTVGVVAALLLISLVSAMGPFGYNPYTGSESGYGYGYGGMMGGYGYGYGYTNPSYPAQTGTAPSTQYYAPVYPFEFGGCMGGFGWNGGYAQAPYAYTGAELNITQAATIGENYVASLGNPDLAVKTVQEYSDNYYMQVYEKSTGIGAFELLINGYTGSIYPAPGPNLMWNTKYGMMDSGILGGIYGVPTANTPVNATVAGEYAQQWLNAYIPGATVGAVTPFYGYYDVVAMVNGANYGMVSVNGYTGQVWYQTWLGTFMQELTPS